MYIVDTMYIIYYNGGEKEMDKMLTINATDARKQWSLIIDNAVRIKPQFIKRTRDELVLSSIDLLIEILKPYKFEAKEYTESDGSVTLSLEKIDIAENAPTLAEAKVKLAESIRDYALDFYSDFEFWGAAPNRKEHIPYILKALVLDKIEKIVEQIECRAGEN